MIRSKLDAAAIRDRIAPELGLADSLLVVELGSDWAAEGLADDLTSWLSAQLERDPVSSR